MDKRAARYLDERVTRGWALLDRELGPEWPAAVDIDQLDLASGRRCIVGQLAVSIAHKHMVRETRDDTRPVEYVETVPLLFGRTDYSTDNRQHVDKQAISHGFNKPDAERHAYGYEELNEEWADRLCEWFHVHVPGRIFDRCVA